MTDKPIIPTAVFPAGEALPAPAAPPPPPPPTPPAPPAWPPLSSRPVPPPVPPPPPVDVYVHVTVDPGGALAPTDPPPGPRWWQRIRIAYNAGLAVLSLILAGPWARLLTTVRDEESLAGAWVMALIPLVILGFVDNARRIEAGAAHPDLWAPKWRAGIARFLLWAAVIGTALALPITTLVYLMTGVRTP